MATIIGFTGKLHSGKDLCTTHLIEQFDFQPGRFAGALKDMMMSFYRYVGEDEEVSNRKIHGDMKEKPCKYLGGRTPRHAMQTLGTDWGREMIYGDIWVDAEMSHLKDGSRFVFSDVRFNNEAACIINAGGHVVEVVRPNYQPPEEALTHASENGIDPKLITTQLANIGTIDDLKDNLNLWLRRQEGLTPG